MWVLTGGQTNVGQVDYPHQRMAAGAHDRVAVRRRDDAWLEERWADPGTRVLVVSGTRVQPVDGGIAWVRPPDAPDGLRVLLGEHDGRAWFAVITGPEAAAGGQGRVGPAARAAAAPGRRGRWPAPRWSSTPSAWPSGCA